MMSDPSEALNKLMAGNRRYVAGTPILPGHTVARRTEIATAQHPIAVVIGCSDSRVPPEIIFDQGLGHLFVIRVAGGIVTNEVMGSVEFAVTELGTPLIMVLGHTGCGAVNAALADGDLPGSIGAIVNALKPAVEEVSDRFGDPDLVDSVVRAHVKMTVDRLITSKPILRESVQTGRLMICGALYDLRDGTVDLVQ